MLLDLQALSKKYGIRPSGVIQVGAHEGEEDQIFDALGVAKRVYIEPCLPAFMVLQTKFGNRHGTTLFNVACSDVTGTASMHVESFNRGQSNSLLAPKLHKEIYSQIVFDKRETVLTSRLDLLPIRRGEYQMLVMDCQGGERLVIGGAEETLKHIDWICTEVLTAELYEGAALVGDLDLMLPEFERVETSLTADGWGDALYRRRRTDY